MQLGIFGSKIYHGHRSVAVHGLLLCLFGGTNSSPKPGIYLCHLLYRQHLLWYALRVHSRGEIKSACTRGMRRLISCFSESPVRTSCDRKRDCCRLQQSHGPYQCIRRNICKYCDQCSHLHLRCTVYRNGRSSQVLVCEGVCSTDNFTP